MQAWKIDTNNYLIKGELQKQFEGEFAGYINEEFQHPYYVFNEDGAVMMLRDPYMSSAQEHIFFTFYSVVNGFFIEYCAESNWDASTTTLSVLKSALLSDLVEIDYKQLAIKSKIETSTLLYQKILNKQHFLNSKKVDLSTMKDEFCIISKSSLVNLFATEWPQLFSFPGIYSTGRMNTTMIWIDSLNFLIGFESGENSIVANLADIESLNIVNVLPARGSGESYVMLVFTDQTRVSVLSAEPNVFSHEHVVNKIKKLRDIKVVRQPDEYDA